MMLLDQPKFLKELDSGAVTIRTALSPNDKSLSCEFNGFDVALWASTPTWR